MAISPSALEGTLSDRLADLGLRGLIGAAKFLPYETRVRAFGALVAGALGPGTRLGARIDQNLAFVFPEMPFAERRRLGRLSADRTARLLIENYSGRHLAERMAKIAPTGPGVPALEAARAQGRPVLLLTAHFGNYEAARACLIARGFVVGGLYRPMKNPYFNAHYVQTMQAIGGPVFPQGRSGTKGLLSFLKSGGIAMLLNDLYVGSGVELAFLGRPARTSTSPAEIAARLGADLIPVWGIRQPDGLSFAVEIDAPLPQGDVLATTAAYNAAVEARIRAHPEQWFWMHRRWKRKWDHGAGDVAGLHPAERPSRRSDL